MDWCSYKVRQGHKVGVWKIIRKGCDLVGSNVFLEVGRWEEGQVLKR